MDAKFFDSLFEGDSANGVKLGMGVTGGDFWARVGRCQNLYRGESIDEVDFGNILSVTDVNQASVNVPSAVQHSAGAVYFYVVRRANRYGDEERTLSAAVKVAFDSNGDLIAPCCNEVFRIWASQVKGPKVRLVWYYSSLAQAERAACFNIYCDSGSGQIDYDNAAAVIDYAGPRFYSYESGLLSEGEYLFCVRTAGEDGAEDESPGEVRVQVKDSSPQSVEDLQIEVI